MRTILLALAIAALLATLPACETGGSALDRPAADTQPLGPLDTVTSPQNQPPSSPTHPYP